MKWYGWTWADPLISVLVALLVLRSGFMVLREAAHVLMEGTPRQIDPAHIRALGVALPYAIANAVFGGTAEYVALWLKGAGVESVFFWYVTGMIGLSLLTFIRMRDTKHNSLITHT